MKKLNSKLTMKGQVRKAYKEMVHLLDPRTIKSDEHIPLSLIKHAKGLVFLSVVKAGFLFAGNVGTGIIIRKLDEDNWSNPASVGIGGLGVGLQLGVTAIETILVLTSEEAVDTFCNNGQFKLGGNFSVAAGPVGRQGEAAFAPAIKSKRKDRFGSKDNMNSNNGKEKKKLTLVNCYSYSHSSGLFAGVSVEGMILLQRPKDNRKYYGAKVEVRDILSGNIEKVEYDRNLHLLHQSLALLAERTRNTSEYQRFDTFFVSKNHKSSMDDDMDDDTRRMSDTSQIKDVNLDDLFEVADKHSNQMPPKAGLSFAKDSFIPLNPPSQPPDFDKMQEYFTYQGKNTIIGEGVKKIKLIEYEWMVELKTLVLDSGLLYTYGMLTFDNNFKEEEYFFDDFEYLMFAIVDGGKLNKSLTKMKKVMNYIFKKGYQYRYLDLMQKDAESAVAFEEIYFNISLNIGEDFHGSPTIGVDLSKLKPEIWAEGKEGELIQLMIWMLRISCPDLPNFRAGINIVVDMSESTNKNIPKARLREKLRKFYSIVLNYFPIKIKRVLVVKSNNSINLTAAISSVGKVMFPSALRKKIQVVSDEGLLQFYPEESIPIDWGGERTEMSETSFRKFLKKQGKRYIATTTEVAKVQKEVEGAKLFKT